MRPDGIEKWLIEANGDVTIIIDKEGTTSMEVLPRVSQELTMEVIYE